MLATEGRVKRWRRRDLDAGAGGGEGRDGAGGSEMWAVEHRELGGKVKSRAR